MTGVDKGLTGSELHRICTLWTGVSYSSSKDTVDTIVAARVNNDKRDAFCKGVIK